MGAIERGSDAARPRAGSILVGALFPFFFSVTRLPAFHKVPLTHTSQLGMLRTLLLRQAGVDLRHSARGTGWRRLAQAVDFPERLQVQNHGTSQAAVPLQVYIAIVYT